MADDETRREERPKRMNPREAGQPSPEEVGSTAGRTHDQVLDATLPSDIATKAKLKGTGEDKV